MDALSSADWAAVISEFLGAFFLIGLDSCVTLLVAAAAEQRAELVICMNMDAHEGEPAAPRVVLRVGRMEERRSWYSSMPWQSQVTFTRSLVRGGAIDGGGGDTVGIWDRET